MALIGLILGYIVVLLNTAILIFVIYVFTHFADFYRS